MRRFTTLSITMLAGIVVGPACGAVIGIDTDRELLDASSPVSSEAGPLPTTTSTTSPPLDSGSDSDLPTPNTCGATCPLLPFGSCNADGFCERKCTGFCNNLLACPEGLDCKLTCTGDACKNVHCTGGKSCTFDCTNGNCDGAVCESPTCTFLCGSGNACDHAACRGKNTSCKQLCSNPGQPAKECKSFLECCPTNENENDDDDDQVQRTCDPKANCPH